MTDIRCVSGAAVVVLSREVISTDAGSGSRSQTLAPKHLADLIPYFIGTVLLRSR